jgi:hypothetical protein
MADEGKSLRQTCRDLCISKPFVLDWLNDDPEFAAQYARARDMLVELHVEQMLEIADSASPETAQAARLQVETRKWIASKLKPKKYGDKPADISVSTHVHNHISVEEQKQLQERHAKAVERMKAQLQR